MRARAGGWRAKAENCRGCLTRCCRAINIPACRRERQVRQANAPRQQTSVERELPVSRVQTGIMRNFVRPAEGDTECALRKCARGREYRSENREQCFHIPILVVWLGFVNGAVEPLWIVGERRVRNRERRGVRRNGTPIRCAEVGVCLNDVVQAADLRYREFEGVVRHKWCAQGGFTCQYRQHGNNAGGLRFKMSDGNISRAVLMTSVPTARKARENPYHDRIENGILTYTAAGREGII